MEWLGELVYRVGGPDLLEAGMLHGLALLSGPDAPLFQQVRERARKRGAPGVGVTLPDGLQLGLPGLHDDHQELIADLVREAASAR